MAAKLVEVKRYIPRVARAGARGAAGLGLGGLGVGFFGDGDGERAGVGVAPVAVGDVVGEAKPGDSDGLDLAIALS